MMNATTLRSMLPVLALALAAVGVGCAAPTGEGGESGEGSASETSTATAAQALTAGCTQAIVVVRHAEDVDAKAGEACTAGGEVAVPGGTQRIRQSCLTPAGKEHAKLYAANLASFVASKGLCEVGRVVTQDPWELNGNAWPSANPFETIAPFAVAENVPMTLLAPSTVFDETMRASLLANAGGKSIVVAWDKEGLSESERPLLDELNDGATEPSFPTRDMLYVFENHGAPAAKLALTEYTQFFQDSAGYFADVAGKSFSASSYYRFYDGVLRSGTAYSPDLVPSKMIVCESDCDGAGVSLDLAKRK